VVKKKVVKTKKKKPAEPKEVKILRAFCRLVRQKEDVADDLDELSYNSDLPSEAEYYGLIRTWIENGWGISFTKWTWTPYAFKLASKYHIRLPDIWE